MSTSLLHEHKSVPVCAVLYVYIRPTVRECVLRLDPLDYVSEDHGTAIWCDGGSAVCAHEPGQSAPVSFDQIVKTRGLSNRANLVDDICLTLAKPFTARHLAASTQLQTSSAHYSTNSFAHGPRTLDPQHTIRCEVLEFLES